MNQDTWNDIKALPTINQKATAEKVIFETKIGRFYLHELLCDTAALPPGSRIGASVPDGAYPDRGVKIELLRGNVPLISRSTNDTTIRGAQELADQLCIDLLVLAMSHELPKDNG